MKKQKNRKGQNGGKGAEEKARAAAEAFVGRAARAADPLGSYTGTAQGPDARPAQDADDL